MIRLALALLLLSGCVEPPCDHDREAERAKAEIACEAYCSPDRHYVRSHYRECESTWTCYCRHTEGDEP